MLFESFHILSLQNALAEAPAGFSIAISSVLCCRLVLNIREANEALARVPDTDHMWHIMRLASL